MGLLCDCKIFVNLRELSFEALVPGQAAGDRLHRAPDEPCGDTKHPGLLPAD